MSSHADTIRAALEFWQEDKEQAAALVALDALLAENQRLREELEAAEHDAKMWRDALNATAEAARLGESDDDLALAGDAE